MLGLTVLVAIVVLIAVVLYDVLQRQHAILRTFPVVGHFRYWLEALGPELRQYIVTANDEERPFSRDQRRWVYASAKHENNYFGFGSDNDMELEANYLIIKHNTFPLQTYYPGDPAYDAQYRIPCAKILGGARGRAKAFRPASVVNVSGMSFGSLSGPAVEALNRGAQIAGCLQSTGEGGVSSHHLKGGDLVWQIGTGYFGCREPDGHFSLAKLKDTVARCPQIRAIEIKLSQGAKPGIGGVLPGAKVTKEIAEVRGVPQGEKCVSPSAHRVFSTPRELVLFMARMRELNGGKPAGFKLCLGSRADFLGICKAMVAEGVTPDFVIVDGGEGGAGAAPLEYEDHIGTPLTEGLLNVHNCLVGVGLRDQVRVGASGKVASGIDIVKRIIQGADYTNSARSMMMAVGCIQAQTCHTNPCPVGVATQDPKRMRALDVPDKTERVFHYQQQTVAQAKQVLASMGLTGSDQLRPHMLRRRIDHERVLSYAEMFDHLAPGQLLAEAPESWRADWALADPDVFRA
jgi:glutamate synthase domain-containing protein 2